MGKRIKLPRIPHAVRGATGRIAVKRVRDLRNEKGEELLGRWTPQRRLIEIEARDIDDVTAWATLWHEWIHATLWDAGLMGLRKTDVERVCDVLASALVREGHTL